MHIDEIIAALAANDLGTIKQAFLALANYPKQEQVTGLRAGNAMTFLEAAAGALRAEFAPMPSDGCAACGLAHGPFEASASQTRLSLDGSGACAVVPSYQLTPPVLLHLCRLTLAGRSTQAQDSNRG